MKKRSAPGVLKSDRSVLDQLKDTIESSPELEYSIASVCQQTGLSRSKFTYCFRHLYEKSFHQYLIAVRMERAKSILTDTDLPIKAIATLAGYKNFKNFLTAFKKHNKKTPAQFRKEIKWKR